MDAPVVVRVCRGGEGDERKQPDTAAKAAVVPTDSDRAEAIAAAAPAASVLARFTVTDTDAYGDPLSPPVQTSKQPSYVAPSAETLRAAWCAKRMSELKHLETRAPAVGVEAMSPLPDGAVMVFSANNMLVEAVHKAFYRHHPLRLSPDVIWLTIAQGLAAHVARNSEELRHLFVSHAGKKVLTVERADFVKGSPHNDWAGVFPEFSAQITEHIGEATRALIENDFSTTTPVDRICSHITLMDTVQSYLEYRMLCGCGLPCVELTGTAADWRSIRKRAAAFDTFGLSWWLKPLLPVLDQFVAAAEGHGQDNRAFWNSMCNLRGASGIYNGPVTGWVQVLFPYLAHGRRNHALGEWSRDSGATEPREAERSSFRPPLRGTGLQLRDFPGSLACAPIIYKDVSTGKSHAMTFEAGITCVVEHADAGLCLEPRTGWAVVDRSAS